MKNKMVTLTQIDAHYCKVDNVNEHQLLVWDILSYEVNTRIPGKPGITKDTRSFLDRRGNKFPYGLVDFVTKKLNDEGYEVEINELKQYTKTIKTPKLNGIIFEDYQKNVIDIAGKYNRGIFVAGTGSGKSIISAGLIAKRDFPVTIITTINKTIFKQLYEDFCKWFPDIEIGRVGDGYCEISHITVGLYQSFAKYDLRKFNNICEMWIADEVHAAPKSLSKISAQLSKTHLRYGLSATPQKIKNDKQKYFEMVGNIGPILKELEDDVVKARVVDCSVFMINYVCDDPIGRSYHSVFREDICCSVKRNTKLLKAAKMLALDKGKSVLFIVDEISQSVVVEKIAKKMGIVCKVAHGRKKSGVNDDIKKMLNDKKIKLVIATAVMKTGTNIPSLDCLVLGSARKSEISILQAIGRSRRTHEGKDKAIIIDSFDRVIGKKKYHRYFQEYSEGRLELYQEKNWFRRKLLL